MYIYHKEYCKVERSACMYRFMCIVVFLVSKRRISGSCKRAELADKKIIDLSLRWSKLVFVKIDRGQTIEQQRHFNE